LSLRFKTSLLIVCAVFLSVVPFSVYSLEEFTRSTVDRERRDFTVAAAVLAEEIRASNYSFLAEEVLDIVGRKEALRKVSLLYARYLDILMEEGGSPPELARTTELLLGRLSEMGVEAGVISLDADIDEIAAGLPRSWEGVTDVLGRSLAYLALEDEQAAEGRFYLFGTRGDRENWGNGAGGNSGNGNSGNRGNGREWGQGRGALGTGGAGIGRERGTGEGAFGSGGAGTPRKRGQSRDALGSGGGGAGRDGGPVQVAGESGEAGPAGIPGLGSDGSRGPDLDTLGSAEPGTGRGVSADQCVAEKGSAVSGPVSEPGRDAGRGGVPGPGEAVASGGEGAGQRTLLGFMCPSGDRRRIYAFLEDVTVEAERSGRAAESVLNQLRYRLSELPLSEHSLAAVFGPDGRRLLTYGGPVAWAGGEAESPGPAAWSLPGEVMGRARARRFSEEDIILPGISGAVIMRVEHFRPLDWYITLATPQAALSAPARALALRLASAALLAVALGVAFALISAKVLSKGLMSLELRTREAEGLDLYDPSSADFFRVDPLADRPDEVGRLAGAVDRLGLSLVTNIQDAIAAGKRQERVLSELTAAREIQSGMLPLPREAPKTPGFDAAAMLHPAKEVGGDLYDFFTAPCGRRCVAIGDVSDKGVPAALFMSMVVTLVRGTIQSGLQPEAALALLNEQLNDRNPSSMFVTLFIGLFDASTGVFTYANGGHIPPAVSTDGGVRFFSTDDPDPLVGAWPGVRYRRREEHIGGGELCLLYTDGVTEAQTAGGALFGQERLGQVLARASRDPEEAVEAVYRSTLEWRGDAPQSDDITMLAFRRKIP
jgi:sigma-B regulation protein RsbU (phosphoserine phosphatase)